MNILVIACDVMREELLRVPRTGNVEFSFLSMGLHVSPDRLRAALSEQLNKERDVDQLVLGFGLCGGAVEGLSSPHAPLVIPRIHDCIPLIMGCTGAEHRTSALEKGTFYLSGGWMEGERTLVSEHRRATLKFGEKKALRILSTMFGAYEKLLFIRTDHPRVEACEDEARALSALLELPLESSEGDGGYLSRVIHGPWAAPEFIRFEKGETITSTAFRS